jgi:hypothetical protein
MSKWIIIKFSGSVCGACKQPLEVGAKAKWYRRGLAFHQCHWTMNEEDGTWTPGACITNPIEQEIENDQKAS